MALHQSANTADCSRLISLKASPKSCNRRRALPALHSSWGLQFSLGIYGVWASTMQAKLQPLSCAATPPARRKPCVRSSKHTTREAPVLAAVQNRLLKGTGTEPSHGPYGAWGSGQVRLDRCGSLNRWLVEKDICINFPFSYLWAFLAFFQQNGAVANYMAWATDKKLIQKKIHWGGYSIPMTL